MNVYDVKKKLEQEYRHLSRDDLLWIIALRTSQKATMGNGMTCEEIRNHARQEYDMATCRGNDEIPENFDDVVTEDYWEHDIACVIAGEKRLALVDYSGMDNPDREYYYGESDDGAKYDPIIHEQAEEICPDLEHIETVDGTRIYYLKPNKKYAQLLRKLVDDELLTPKNTYEIIRSLLLGYNNEAIIAYLLHSQALQFLDPKEAYAYYKDQFDDDEYDTPIKIAKRIGIAKKWIDENI